MLQKLSGVRFFSAMFFFKCTSANFSLTVSSLMVQTLNLTNETRNDLGYSIANFIKFGGVFYMVEGFLCKNLIILILRKDLRFKGGVYCWVRRKLFLYVLYFFLILFEQLKINCCRFFLQYCIWNSIRNSSQLPQVWEGTWFNSVIIFMLNI